MGVILSLSHSSLRQYPIPINPGDSGFPTSELGEETKAFIRRVIDKVGSCVRVV